MKIENIVFINDVHLSIDTPVGRLDDVHETGLKKFKFVLDWAYEHYGIICLAGDLSVKPRSWRLLVDLLREITKDDQIYAVYGQHDTYMYSEETRDATILGILASEGRIKILGSDPVVIDEAKVRIWGTHYGQSIPDTGPRDQYRNILVIHASIAEKAQWITQDYMDARQFLKDYPEFDIIHCGDIHQKFCVWVGDRMILNSGPMIRREATPYNFQHQPGFWVYEINSGKTRFEIIPHVFSDQVLSREHIDLDKMANEILQEFIESVRTEVVGDTSSIIANLWAIIKENEIDKDVIDVIIDVIGERRMHADR